MPLFEGFTPISSRASSCLSPTTCCSRRRARHCKNDNLQLTELFFIKITQLYEMIIVRHGLVIVGYSYGAKTMMYRTLAAALTEMKARGAPQQAVSYYVLNPKSITLGRV